MNVNRSRPGLAQTRKLLQQHGDTYTARRLQAHGERFIGGDATAIVSAVSKATGGSGSRKDSVLSVEIGDGTERTKVDQANAQLRALVKNVDQRARAAAAAHDIPLIR